MFPKHFHYDAAFNAGQSNFLIWKIQPTWDTCSLELESKMVVTWQREVISNIFESDLFNVLPHDKTIQLLPGLVVFWHVVKDLSGHIFISFAQINVK